MVTGVMEVAGASSSSVVVVRSHAGRRMLAAVRRPRCRIGCSAEYESSRPSTSRNSGDHAVLSSSSVYANDRHMTIDSSTSSGRSSHNVVDQLLNGAKGLLTSFDGGGDTWDGGDGDKGGRHFMRRVGEDDGGFHDRHEEDENDIFTQFYRHTSKALATSGVLVVLLGGMRAWVALCRLLVSRRWFKDEQLSPAIMMLRFKFCNTVLLSLDFLVASDVVETLTSPLHKLAARELTSLAALILIRALLSHLLDLEIRHIDHHMARPVKVKSH
eukprot:jgi/Chlat1/9253/Chrsp99S08525